MHYDLIVVGGGLAGSSFAKRMANLGARVLLLEREKSFRDRIRGEGMHPWGVVEAKALGIYDTLLEKCALHANAWFFHTPGIPIFKRDVAATNPHGVAELCFNHPAMQETLFELAASAGADARRNAAVTSIEWAGPSPRVAWTERGQAYEASARLVVGADGSHSAVRSHVGFDVESDPNRLVTAGVLVEGPNIPGDSIHAFNGPRGQSLFLPQGPGRARAYAIFQDDDPPPTPLSGDRHKADFVAFCREQHVPEEWLEGARLTSLLAQFHGADRWVRHPAKDGVALIGDAAGKPDPCWGCGMSLAVRDARTLADALAAHDDWNPAAHAYAAEHDRYFDALHRLEAWYASVFWDRGEAADARRALALTSIVRDGVPDIVGRGPESPIPEHLL